MLSQQRSDCLFIGRQENLLCHFENFNAFILIFNKLFQEYSHLRKQYWGQHLWVRGYFVATTGTVADEVIK